MKFNGIIIKSRSIGICNPKGTIGNRVKLDFNRMTLQELMGLIFWIKTWGPNKLFKIVPAPSKDKYIYAEKISGDWHESYYDQYDVEELRRNLKSEHFVPVKLGYTICEQCLVRYL